MSFRADFARRLRAREPLAGTFVKSRDPAVVEILGHAGYDFAVLDAEHVAFGRADIAAMAVASRAARLPLVVRVPEAGGPWIATALDAGAAGVMVPQVGDTDTAARLVRAVRHGAGGLGFSPSVPGADYGARGVAGHLAQHPLETLLICQIEDPEAVARAEAIAAVDGVDGLLVGPVDLAVAAGLSDPQNPSVAQMSETTARAAAAQGKAAGLFIGDPASAAHWRARGVTLFVHGSDQALMAQAARAGLAAMRKGWSAG